MAPDKADRATRADTLHLHVRRALPLGPIPNSRHLELSLGVRGTGMLNYPEGRKPIIDLMSHAAVGFGVCLTKAIQKSAGKPSLKFSPNGACSSSVRGKFATGLRLNNVPRLVARRAAGMGMVRF